MKDLTVIVLVCFVSSVVYADPPMYLERGKTAPFSGMLLTVADSARLTASLIAARKLVVVYKSKLEGCVSMTEELVENTALDCREDLNRCLELSTELIIKTEVPWYVWTVGGAVIAIAFGGGIWIGVQL